MIDSATGEQVQRVVYDEYGLQISATGAALHPLGFAGGIADPDTGLVKFGYRDYDPVSGRWLEPDPMGHAGGSPNLYLYAGGDPVNSTDPTGLSYPVFHRKPQLP